MGALSAELIITPNHRLSTALLRQQALKYANDACWQTPDILPLSAWWQRTWLQLLDAGAVPAKQLLTSAQSLQIWQQLIEAEHGEVAGSLLRGDATATQAYQAWGLLKQWQLPLSAADFQVNDDCVAFYAWAQQFLQRCEEADFIDNYMVPEQVLNLLCEVRKTLPSSVSFYAFHQLNPQEQALYALLDDAGVSVKRESGQCYSAKVQRVSCVDEPEEIRSVVQWAKQAVQAGETPVACVVSDLTAKRAQYQREFLKAFHAAELNISGGQPLSSCPMISNGFDLLTLFASLHRSQVSQNLLSDILLSPFIGEAEQCQFARAQLDKKLREYAQLHFSSKHLLTLSELEPRWHDRLQALLEETTSLKLKRLPSEWLSVWGRVWQIMGWPGERVQNSEEYQQAQRWQACLEDFTQLDTVSSTMGYTQALALLRQQAGQIIFQGQTSAEAPVQVLGVLEAAGSEFHSVWLTGMNDGQWPPPAKPNPFLPFALQRQWDLPHSSAAKETVYCEQLLQSFMSSAQQVVMSYAKQQGDDVCEASPLIQTCTEVALNILLPGTMENYSRQVFHASDIECLSDHEGPPLPSEFVAKGGVGLFKRQALCPFQAFASLRLHAESLGDPQLGLDAAERGTLLHEVLEKLWLKLETQACLLQQSEHVLNLLIESTVAEVLTQSQYYYPALFGKHFQTLEAQRLQRLTLRWLQLEKARENFTVTATEEWREVTVEGITVNIKIDRIDTLANGQRLLIDYKTGLVSIYQCLGERPSEPQLPLYCIADDDPVHGVVYAQLRPTALCYKGVAATEIMPGVKAIDAFAVEADTWSELQHYWQQQLSELAQEFQQGVATVSPKGLEACQYCDLQSLCRIHEVVA